VDEITSLQTPSLGEGQGWVSPLSLGEGLGVGFSILFVKCD